MNKVLSISLGVATVALVTFLAVVAVQPSELHVERSVTIAATPADVFPYANDFDKWQQWNPWREMDPSQVETFSENKVGVGAWYNWAGNEDVGEGRMTIRESVPDQKVVHDLHFIEPFKSEAVVTFTLAPAGDQTQVTWGFDGKNDFLGKAFGLFVDMDTMLGADFQRGLDKLKPLAEKAATERVAAERAALEAAAALPVVPEGAAVVVIVPAGSVVETTGAK